MGGQFSGNGMIFVRTPYGVAELKLEPLKRRSQSVAGVPAGGGVPAPGMAFRKRKRAIETLSEFGGRFFGQGSVFRAGGLLRGQVCGECSLPSEWPSGQGVGSPRPVWFFGNGSGGKLIAVRGGWRGFRPGFGSPRRWASAGASVRRAVRWNRNGCPERVLGRRTRYGFAGLKAE